MKINSIVTEQHRLFYRPFEVYPHSMIKVIILKQISYGNPPYPFSPLNICFARSISGSVSIPPPNAGHEQKRYDALKFAPISLLFIIHHLTLKNNGCYFFMCAKFYF